MLRVWIAFIFAAVAFVVALYLPLSISGLIHGDPGMPGGAALIFLGFPLGLVGAIAAGLFSFHKIPNQFSK
jgi:hypothetical protein